MAKKQDTFESYDEVVGLWVELATEATKPETIRRAANRFFARMEEFHQFYFDAETSPEGEPWAELAQSTIDRKGHDQILFETGRLMESLTERGSPDAVRDIFANEASTEVVFGTSVEYSVFHMEGTTFMPARRHVGVPFDAVDDLADDLTEFIVHAFEEE
jgi:phage gpG-like protein